MLIIGVLHFLVHFSGQPITNYVVLAIVNMSRHINDYAVKEQPGRPRVTSNTYEATLPSPRITSQSIELNEELPKGSGLAKLAALHRKQYLNPLARLDYEDREMEVYTKISKQTQATVQKKLKARNQLADFNENEFDEDR